MADGSVYVFDAYGTLLDIAAAARRVLSGHPEQARLLAEVWRGRQLEYAWIDMALGQATDFWGATTRALPRSDPAHWTRNWYWRNHRRCCRVQ
jgi:2-haloacid dehalogenase